MRIDLQNDVFVPKSLSLIKDELIFVLPTCNGVPVDRCIALDTEQNWLENIQVDSAGNIVLDERNNVKIARLNGHIEMFPIFSMKPLLEFANSIAYALQLRYDAATVKPPEERSEGDKALLELEFPQTKKLPYGPLTEEYVAWLDAHSTTISVKDSLGLPKILGRTIQWVDKAD